MTSRLACGRARRSRLPAARPRQPLTFTARRSRSRRPISRLTSDAGTPWTLSASAGKVVALFFGYTHCDDTCPDTLAKLAAALRGGRRAPADAEIAFVTVDPQRDTPAVIASLLRRFTERNDRRAYRNARADRGRRERAYHMSVATRVTPKDGAGYDEAHSSFTFLIDRAATNAWFTDDDDAQAAFAADMRTLLK